MQNAPLFSIITVSYNAGNLMRETMDSILQQTCMDYEVVVKDACSKDDTLQIIPKNEKIRVYSEKDSGIYDGMNAGIGYAKGTYLIFMNCGDTFYSPNVLENVKSYLCCKRDFPGIIYGDYERDGIICNQPSKMTGFTAYRSALCHQTMFFHRSVFDKCGRYCLEYPIKSDYEKMLDAFFSGFRFTHIPCIICHYQGGGFSENNKKNNEIEEKVILKKHFRLFTRFKYKTILILTFQRLRIYIASDKSPRFIRKVYRNIVNLINK